MIGTDGEDEIGYQDFYRTLDIVVMGRKTYDQILKMGGDFQYQDKKCYVFSRSLTGSNEMVEFINDDIVEFMKSLKKESGKRIWVVGGGEVLHPLLHERLVDEFYIQFAPSIIGSGIPMFLPGNYENKLELLNVKQCKQLAELHYVLK